MTTTLLAPRFVAAPTTTPAKFGLLSVATVLDAGPHEQLGIEYEPEFCGTAHLTAAACMFDVTPGAIAAAANNARLVTLTPNPLLPNHGAGAYDIDWGDGSTSVWNGQSAATHTYAANGTYTVTVEGPDNYHATVTLTVTNGQTTASTPGTVTATEPQPKTPDDGRDIVVGSPFAIYHLARCRSVGNWEGAQTYARRAVELGEGRAVEEGFETLMFPQADNVTPSGVDLDPILALAVLEKQAGKAYGGVPTIHIGRGMGTVLATLGAILRVGDHLETQLGSLVAAGAGYAGAWEGDPDSTAPMYATGPVVLRRGPIETHGPSLATSGSGYTNEFSVLSERVYTASFECFALKVDSLVTSCCASTVP